MLRARYYRPVLCVLLAVSTAVGAMPVKVCACPSEPMVSEIPAAPVCEATPVPCCASCTMHCCSEPVKPQLVEKSCQCLTCECQSPVAPQPNDSTPPQAPVDSTALQFASAPPAPPVLLTLPDAAFPRLNGDHSEPPPVDLITALSRLTC